MSKHTENDPVVSIKKVLSRFSRRRSSLLPALQKVQGMLGYIPEEVMPVIAERLQIPAVDVYEVVTFYRQFRLNPPGRHSVRVCMGTACHTKGGRITLDAWKRRLNIEPGETTEDLEFDLDTVACVGCCVLAPVTVVDNSPEGKVDPTRVDGLLLSYQRQREKEESHTDQSE